MRRIGLLGGAFNPPHEGHLALARLALQQLELDELRLVPTARSPHKPDPGGPSAEARLHLVKAAAEALGDARVTVSDLELRRGGTSYTADTLEHLVQAEPEGAWIVLIGADQLPGLPSWRRAARLFELASVAVAGRPGWEATPPEGLLLHPVSAWSGAPGELVRLPSTDLDLASTELRSKLAAGSADEDHLPGLPDKVRAAITAENLYR
jgi:nicotinate-nucleotide adenylyltransferase